MSSYESIKNFIDLNYSELFESGKDSKEINEIILRGVFSDKDHNPTTRDLIRKYKSRYLKSYVAKKTDPNKKVLAVPTSSDPSDKIQELFSLIQNQQIEIDNIKTLLGDKSIKPQQNSFENLILEINSVHLDNTKRETFHITDENVELVNSFYKENNVSKSSLINFILSEFFKNIPSQV